MVRYGREWDDDVSDVSIELSCFLNGHTWDDGSGVLKPWQHLRNAVSNLWPETDEGGRRGYVWHDWSEPRIQSYTESSKSNYVMWWGPSATCKSTDAGVYALADWLSAWDRTTVIVCSTSREMLRKRIFGQIVKFWNMRPGLPGKYMRGSDCIVAADGDEKNGIFGVPLAKGASNLGPIGIHNERVVLILDEMQGCEDVIMEAAENLSVCPTFRLIGIGNPVSRLDLLGRYSEPSRGWGSITPEHSSSWKTRFGTCYFFNGLKSPGIRDPKRFPFMLQQRDIDLTRKRVGENSILFWSQRIGFVPPEGMTDTVLTESLIAAQHAMDPPRWLTHGIPVAGCDPAFATGGNKAILTIGVAGVNPDTGGMQVAQKAEIQMPHVVQSGKPIAYRLAEQVRKHCEAHGVAPENLAVDVTATQSVFGDVLENEWAPGIRRLEFGNVATDDPISERDGRSAKLKYRNLATQLWFNVALLVREARFRGMSVEAAKQFCVRRVLTDGIRIWLEPKGDMRGRTGESPDEADACACMTERAMDKMRGALRPGRERNSNFDLDSAPNTYLESAV
jgi:hypothetical protein